MFPRGDMRNLNHKEERNQLFKVYDIPGTFTPTKSKLCALCFHLIDNTLGLKGLSDLSKIKQLVRGKPGLQISIF